MINAKKSLEIIEVKKAVDEVFGVGLHHKQSESLGNAALGLLNSESLILHRLGKGLAKARGIEKKHATKQIDRVCFQLSLANCQQTLVKQRLAKILATVDHTAT